MEAYLGKALEFLKTSGWQTGSIAAADALFIYLSSTGVLPELGQSLLLAAWVILFLSTALTVAAIGQSVQVKGKAYFASLAMRQNIRKLEKEFRDQVPYLSGKERQIFGYLLHHRIKTFTADHSGGYAATLIARRYIHYAGVRGQSFDIDECPMLVPDYVWKVLEEDPSNFPYIPDLESGHEAQPWRIHWMAR
ncbi:hypothetical protein [Rhizobium leguminosarum]|uniref:hypothetical protein n=1 Tax=Rhizobium leguminosarum TaxID=384 RepID=UPI001C909002|nr:hypothetical protein [Rhizobium leguminosarum]MBY2906055.1 hypothetical protein [Rhizobium leguminosarum]